MAMKIIHVVLLASVKYILTLPYALLIGLDYFQAVIAVLIGGIGGFLFFFYLSKKVILFFGNIRPFLCNIVPSQIKVRFQIFCERKNVHSKKSKVFSRKSRFLVRFRKTYGFWGIIVTTPVILTIPVGAFLARKYYSHRRHLIPYMILSILAWTGLLSGLVHIFPKVFF
jgi:hypothetical protein